MRGFGPLLIAFAAIACTEEGGPDAGPRDATNALVDASSDAAAPEPCPSCMIDQDCTGGASCGQFAGDTYCAPPCSAGCAPDRACVTVPNVQGDPTDLCLPITDICGTIEQPDAGAADATLPVTCGALVGPTIASCCSACRNRPECQPNGCYNGWYCNSQSCRCQAPPDPATCNRPDAGPLDVGPLPDGAIGPNGGLLDELRFAIVGDTRPPNPDDTASYPTEIISQIWQGVEAETPRVPFAVTTGDYIFASTRGFESIPQLELYLGARANFTNIVFYSFGNHECTGATASNCGPGTPTGSTRNYDEYMSRMLGPLGKTRPYYTIRVDATDGTWTSKFVFVAPNAWTTDQEAWLENELSQPTTYTFIVRHEATNATRAPGVLPSAAIMARHPYTILIAGHTHTFSWSSFSRQIVVGTGGAPLSSNANYGYVIAHRRADGAIEFSAHDYSTRAIYRTFAVRADGTFLP